MFSSRRSIDSIQEFIVDLKKYIELQKKFIQLDFVSKMTILAAAFTLGIILFLLGAIVILFLSLALASVLTDWLENPALGYGIVALLFILLSWLIYNKREKWITRPLATFLANLFINHNVK